MRFKFRVTDSTTHFAITSMAIVELNGKILLLQDASSQHHGRWTLPRQISSAQAHLSSDAESALATSTTLKGKATGLVGIYQTYDEAEAQGSLLFTFVLSEPKGMIQTNAKDFLNAEWFSYKEIFNMPDVSLLYPQIRKMIKDYRKGKRFPLDIIQQI